MKHQLFIAVSLLLVFAAIAAACAPALVAAPQSAPEGNAPAPTVAAPASTAAPAVAQPTQGGTVTTSIGADPTFNP